MIFKIKGKINTINNYFFVVFLFNYPVINHSNPINHSLIHLYFIQLFMLQNLHSIWKKHELKKVYLFGSYARNEQKPSSDIDFLIEHDIDFSLFDLIKLQLNLETEFNIDVDLISNNSVSKFLKDSINRDKILIYSQNEEFENSFIEQNKF